MKLPLLACALLLCSCAPTASTFNEYLPLEVGNSWDYSWRTETVVSKDVFGGAEWFRIAVTNQSGTRHDPYSYFVRFDGQKLLAWAEEKKIGTVLIDFSQPSDKKYTINTLCDSSAQNTPFENTIEVSYGHQHCADGGTLRESFARGIGRTSYTDDNFGGAQTSKLTRARIHGQELEFPPSPEYFPLEIGNRWEYNADFQEWLVTGVEKVGNQFWYLIAVKRFPGLSPLDSEPSRVDWRVRFQGKQLLMWDEKGKASKVWADFDHPVGKPYEVEQHLELGLFVKARAVNRSFTNSIEVRYLPRCGDCGKFAETFERGVGISTYYKNGFASYLVHLVRARIGGKEITFRETPTK